MKRFTTLCCLVIWIAGLCVSANKPSLIECLASCERSPFCSDSCNTTDTNQGRINNTKNVGFGAKKPNWTENCGSDSWCLEFCPYLHKQKTNKRMSFFEDDSVKRIISDLKDMNTTNACNRWCSRVHTVWGLTDAPKRMLDCWNGKPPANCALDEGCKKWCLPQANEDKDPIVAFFTACFNGQPPPSDCKDETIFGDMCAAAERLRMVDENTTKCTIDDKDSTPQQKEEDKDNDETQHGIFSDGEKIAEQSYGLLHNLRDLLEQLKAIQVPSAARHSLVEL